MLIMASVLLPSWTAAIQAAGADNVAAFIAEPVVGATLGAATAPGGYFKEIRRICDEHNVLVYS